MKSVVLDGYALNPGDLSWKELEALTSCQIYDRTSPDELLMRAAGAEALFTNKVVLDKKVMEQLPDLKYIGVMATGYNVVDIDEAHRRGIVVTNIPSYGTESVVQAVFAHILNIFNQVGHYSTEVRSGKWSHCKDFTYWNTPLVELYGKTLGIIGLGHIGMAVARVALAFGLQVIAQTSKSKSALPQGISPVSKEDLFRQSDIVTLHAPLTDDTRGIVNKEMLDLMKPSAILINTSRGPLVNEQDLADALNKQKIAAAGLDVLGQEPPAIDNPLLTARNCYITPHIAWATYEARERLMNILITNYADFLKGKIVNNVAG